MEAAPASASRALIVYGLFGFARFGRFGYDPNGHYGVGEGVPNR